MWTVTDEASTYRGGQGTTTDADDVFACARTCCCSSRLHSDHVTTVVVVMSLRRKPKRVADAAVRMHNNYLRTSEPDAP